MNGARRPVVVINEVLDVTGESHALLEQYCDVRYGRSTWDDPHRSMSTDELVEACSDADAVVGASRDRFTRSLVERCPRLQIVSKYGIGTERIDVAAATEHGVLVGYTPVAENYESVAEYTVALALALTRRLRQTEEHLRQGGWRGPDVVTSQLYGKTVGLVGYGRVARAVAARLDGFGVRLVAHDPHVEQSTVEVPLLPLPELLETADIVSVHAVSTPETEGLLGSGELRRMKQEAYLINTSRGTVVDHEALLDVLRDGRLAGVALDVFHPEPPDVAGELFACRRVLATPHVAGYARETLAAICLAAAKNVLAALSGGLPPMLRNPEATDNWRRARRRPVLTEPARSPRAASEIG